MNFNSIKDYSEYYARQLILQYRTKPKAFSAIKALAGNSFINFELMGLWRNIDYAQGEALAAISELIGIQAEFNGIDFSLKYFATEKYSQKGNLTEVQEGFNRYGKGKEGVFFKYSDYSRKYITLAIGDFHLRGLIRMRIQQLIGVYGIGNIQLLLDMYYSGVYLSESFLPPTMIYNMPDATNPNRLNLINLFNSFNDMGYLLHVPGIKSIINLGG